VQTQPTRLVRSRSDTLIAGVAGGIASYLGVDPVFVRLVFVLLAFSGVGIALYLILWLIMPLEGAAGDPPPQAIDEMRQQAYRVADELREAFGGQPRRPRYDPMSGEPLDEAEIPIQNLGPQVPTPDAAARRAQTLGLVLLGVGGFLLLTMIPGFGALVGRFLFPAVLIGAGIWVLLRRRA
jgi:phage shock protein C